MSKLVIPEGFVMNSKGHLVPEASIKPFDKAKSDLAIALCAAAKEQATAAFAFKITAMEEVKTLIASAHKLYNVKPRDKSKGNFSFTDISGKYKVTVAIQDVYIKNENLVLAQKEVDALVEEQMKDVVNEKFKSLLEVHLGKRLEEMSVAELQRLRNQKFNDTRWTKAKRLIGDAIQHAGQRVYIRFFEKDDTTGKYTMYNINIMGSADTE